MMIISLQQEKHCRIFVSCISIDNEHTYDFLCFTGGGEKNEGLDKRPHLSYCNINTISNNINRTFLLWLDI
jgi:hypothetical protein